MSGFFKKALGMFVEFEDNPDSPAQNQTYTRHPPLPKESISTSKPSFNQGEIEKFEKHFQQLFDKANLPGPDYFEFWKMMETLEAHIPDERARITAVFASLTIQGLTKDKLLESATHYKVVIEKDKNEFQKAVEDKSKTELETRKNELNQIGKKITDSSIQIQNLTKEITEAQSKMATLKTEIHETEQKITANKNNYGIASDAMLNKLTQDIQKIQTII